MSTPVKSIAPSQAFFSQNSFEQALRETQKMVESSLAAIIDSLDGNNTILPQAIKYASLNGGKRLRPFLCMVLGQVLKAPKKSCIRVGCAIELLHSYSLIHDDLPAMDNADLRRGKPSCHVQFDEATAILAGDAMIAYAFEILSAPETDIDPQVRCELVQLMAQAAGPEGMALGQMMDIQSEREILSKDRLNRLHKLKTGLLIEFSCTAPAILAKTSSQTKSHVQSYGQKIGLLFQIVDDILDAEGDPIALGKPTGRDQDLRKNTYVSLYGLEEAKRKAHDLYEAALNDLNSIGGEADLLKEVTHFLISRKI